ncbi:hypothetical protein M426DRAFT_16133 [Hypoxylon sp. CI-4A]|nr:hypothetical protein M426DRAFT_16133 [Hypoxylon sp. CI-4A]
MLDQLVFDVSSVTRSDSLESLKNSVSVHITEKEITNTLLALEDPEVEFEVDCTLAQTIALQKPGPQKPSIIRLDLPQGILKDGNTLIETWNNLCNRHHILRSIIVKVGSGKDAVFRRRVFRHPKYISNLSHRDLELLNSSQEPARLVIDRQSSEDPRVYLYLPYAIADRTSLSFIWRDFLSLLVGAASPQRLCISDYDAVARRRSEEEAKSFWQAELGNLPALTIHSFPVDRQNTYQTTSIDSSVAVSGASIRRVAKALGVSVHALFYAAFGIVLGKHSQTSGEAVVFVAEGRDQTVEGYDTVVGFADQEYPLKFQSAEQSVAKAVVEIERFNTQASSNAFIGYEYLRREYDAAATDFKLIICEKNIPEPTDDSLPVSVIIRLADTLQVSARHDTLIPSSIVKILLNHFITAIFSVVSNPTASVGRINIISPDEQSLILELGKPLTKPVYDNVHRLFERQVELTPDLPAVQFETDKPVSYDELNRLANRVARQLPVGRGSFVPVCQRRSTNIIVSLLAILKTGGAYVTLDPDSPDERNKFIVEDIDAKLVLVDRSTAGRFPNEMIIEDIIETSRHNEETNLSNNCDPSDPVYVIYTSGSTGKPKGVLHKHSSATSGLAAFPTIENLRQLFFHNPTFSAAQRSIWSTLKQGGCLCLASKDNLTIHIGRTIRQMEINVIDVTPSTALLLTPGTVPSLRRLTVAGELINPALIPVWVNELQLLNAYGLSENTQVNWRREMVLGQNPQNIGRPSDTTSSYVLYPGTTELCPLLVPGELCLGGDQLASYYINRPEKTAEAFIENPFGEGRLYRTGDMVLALEDGSIEMIGRIDFQVKVNGQRVEPGDSNSIIQTHPDVLNSSVVATSVFGGKVHLVGVIVPKAEATEWSRLRTEVRDLLKKHIPSYMIPTYWIKEESLPLNINGKVDIPQLVKHVQSLGRDYLLQSSVDDYSNTEQHSHHEDETALRGIVAEVLHLSSSQLAPQNTFQELGGSSLDAIRVSSKAYEANLEISITDILGMPLRELFDHAKHLRDGGSHVITPFSLLPADTKLDKTGVDDAYPTTSLQDTFLADSLLGNTTYVYRRYYQLKDSISFEGLKDGLKKLIPQLPLLRTTFVPNKASFFSVVKKEKETALSWETLDMTLDEYSAMQKRPIELGSDFVRFTALRNGLAVTMHHALFDFWSHDFLMNDLATVIRGQQLQQRPSFAQFIQYLRSQDEDEYKKFWKSKLEGASPSLLGYATEEKVRSVQAELTEDIHTFASHHNVSLGSLVYAAWAIVLSIHTNQNDIVFGTVFSGRDAPVPGVIKIAGPIITTAPFRITVDPDTTLIDLAKSLQEEMWRYIPQARYGIRNILKASGHRTPLMDTMVNVLVKEGESEKFSDILERCGPYEPNYLDYTMLEAEQKADKTILRILSALPTGKANFLLGNVVETIKAMLNTPGCVVSDLCPTSPEEKSFIESISTHRSTEPNLLAYSLLDRMVARSPNKVALKDLSGSQLTYKEFDARINHVAQLLRSKNVGRGDIVPLGLEKSINTLVAVFGVLKSGAAFTPLDPKNGKERNDFIIQDVSARVAITDSVCSEIFDGFSGSVIDITSVEASNVAYEKPAISAADLAYVIYTSGSTGRPKGVKVSHASVAASTEGMIEACKIDENWHVLWFLNYVFDASYFDVFTVLSSGGTISIASQESLISDLASAINSSGVKQVMLTPTISKLVSPDEVPNLETLLVCGEPITPELVNTWASRVEVYNGYGPTEATILMTVSKVTVDGSLKSIGYPLKAVKASILHPKNLTPVPHGAVGELCVSGAQVAIGYVNRPDLTAAAFIKGEDGEIIYRTGDYARWLPNGEIECFGRKDNQVKINGFRIELAEIENVILSHAGDLVNSCVVGAANIQNKKQIVVYYVPQETSPTAEDTDSLLYPKTVVAPSAITERLHALAHYMIPKIFLPFWRFPLLASGKADRKKLNQIAESMSTGDLARYSEPRKVQQQSNGTEQLSSTETILRDAWANLFGVEAESIILSDLFYNYGGDSIAAINLSSMLRRQNYSLSVNDIMTYASLGEQATKMSPVKVETTQAVKFVVHPSVHSRLQAAGLAAEDIEEIYPAAPGQAEFLTQGHTEDQFWQLMTIRPVPQDFEFDVWLDLTRQLTAENQILRAMYLKQDESDPLSWVQVIHKKPVLDLAVIDCPDENEKSALIRGHWDRKFSIGRPFVRYLILKHPDGSMDICTKLDHAMYDGTLLRIFDDQFAALRDGQPMPPKTPFKEFVDHIQKQNRTKMLDFWKENLKGTNFSFPSHIASPRVHSSVGATIDIPVNAFAQSAGVTASTVFQTAYSLLLSILSGNSDDVTYDYLLTGRNVDMDEPQLINGTCANFLPFRSRLESTTALGTVLKKTQSSFWEMTENGLVGLGDIYNALGVSRSSSAAKTLFLFQPFEPATGKQSNMRWIVMAMSKVTMFVNYAIMFEVFKDARGHRLKMGYDERLFSKDRAKEVLDLYILIVTDMLASKDGTIGDLLRQRKIGA